MKTFLSRPALLLGSSLVLGLLACSDDGASGPSARPVPPIHQFATAPRSCMHWSCTIGDCGYDPATDSRGACCLEWELGAGQGESQPSCGGRTFCQLYPAQCGPDAYRPGDYCSTHSTPGDFYCDPFCISNGDNEGWSDPCD
jgi:hypothetical protein